MEQESADSLTFEDILNSSGRVETQELMSNLQEFGELPEDATPEHIDMLLNLVYQNIPQKLNND